MCERDAPEPTPDRRRVLTWGLAVGAGLLLPGRALASSAPVAAGAAVPASAAAPEIRPRSAWAQGIAAVAGLPVEQPGNVKVLLVHHTDSPNTDGPDEIAGRIRSFHAFHTGTKGWPDVAYNFFVDRHGGIWEGRTGSLAGPVIGDATGGNQGHTQLCCFIGSHVSEPPTPAALASMTALLAHLAQRYEIDPTPGATATFTSRGSNRWPEGATVTTPTIEGHRAMSATACPGDAAYAWVEGPARAAVASLVGQVPPTSTSTSTPPATTTTSTPPTTTTTEATPSTTAPVTSASTPDREPSPVAIAAGAAVAGGAALVGGIAVARRRRRPAEGPVGAPPAGDDDPPST